ncbi:Actin-related protein 4 [Chlorella vulgaris]
MSGPVYGGDEVNAVVLDVGTYHTKAGYAGEDTPKFVFPSAVGSLSGGANGMDIDGAKRTLYVGTHALTHRRDKMEIITPFKDGRLDDWEVAEGLLDHALKQQMRLATESHPIMLAEPSFNSKAAREKAAELLFEKYQSPAVFMAKNAVLSSFASGRPTSLVVDAGHERTVVSAVHDGFVLQKSVASTPLAGQLLSQCMAAAVESRGTPIRPRFEFTRREGHGGKLEVVSVAPPATTASYRAWCVEAIAGDIKDTICRVSDNAFDPQENANIPTVMYELPDGQEIAIGTDRFAIPEILFNPALLEGYAPVAARLKAAGGFESLQGIHHLANDCISQCDVDVRKDLYGGLVLTGGTAGFAALRDRLEKEVSELAPQMAKVKVVCSANAVERRYGVWIGGSILASLGTFQQMWMSKAEYREYGAGLIHKKAP